MDPFKKFVAGNQTYELTGEENKQVDKVFDDYQKLFGYEVIGKKDPVRIYKNNIKNGLLYLDKISYHDHASKTINKVPVYVSFDKSRTDNATYSKHDNAIILFYYSLLSLTDTQKRSKIVHELVHAKQHYKEVSPEYRRAIQKRVLPSGAVSTRSWRGYFLDPIEYPVQVSVIVHEMDRQYRLILQKIKRGMEVKFWEYQKKKFLQLLDEFISQLSRRHRKLLRLSLDLQ